MSNLPEVNSSERVLGRKKLVEDFKTTHYGNDWQSNVSREIYRNPLFQYSTGILFPAKVSIDAETSIDEEIIEDFNDDEELLEHQSNSWRNAEEDENNSEDLNVVDLASQYKPSAFGIQFLSKPNSTFTIFYGYSTYSEKDNPDPKDESTWKFDKKLFVEKKYKDEIELTLDSNKIIEKEILDGKLKIYIKTRERKNQILASVSMVNTIKYELNPLEEDKNKTFALEDCFFQCGMKIIAKDHSFFEPIDSAINNQGDENGRSLDLLFRKKKSFASGQGCASDWSESLPCKEIWTEFIPSYEISKISPSDDIAECNMHDLADINNKLSKEKRYECLENLVEGYEKWLREKKEESLNLDSFLRPTAENHLSSAYKCLSRIKKGIDLIKDQSDPNIEIAFRLTNHAMAIQFNRLNFLNSKNKNDDLNCRDESLKSILKNCEHEKLESTWRPFQIAFLLMIIPEIARPEEFSEERELVDLIWFPTGGGKTEAYFGVFAFTTFLRRLKDPAAGCGVSSIMRYTLRLLTSDQFRRSSALICAMEYLRKNPPVIFSNCDLGKEEISLGLWLGREGSPKSHSEAKRKMRDVKNDKYDFVLHECPWCKSSLNNVSDGGYESSEGKVKIKCSDSVCEFHNKLPIKLWEEAIFEEKPTLVLSTVDNFAKLTWYEKAITTFKNDDYHPPELIIQDELHLISGPLGTMTALYENVLLNLLLKRPNDSRIKPKIVGASATLTFSDSQTKALYRGREKSIFPPQIIDWGDSFFAKEVPPDETEFGRQYIGYFGSSKGSMIEASTNAVIPLLQTPQARLPQLVEDAISGQDFLKVDLPLDQGSSFSVFHGGDFTIYKIKEVTAESDHYALKLENSLKENLNGPSEDKSTKRDVLYPQPGKRDTVFDPYGTLVWYFNSKRELGYISNQITRLEDRLSEDASYNNLFKLGSFDNPRGFRRRLKFVEEMTGRLSQSDIERIKSNLNVPWKQVKASKNDYTGIDILLATNMISVGVDIPRLGLMVINGQPRTTSEYIQASSRIGRTHPGLVTTLYNHSKAKDRSIYEQFKNFHQSFYKFVEEVSVTPFAKGARERGLAAIFIALVRGLGHQSSSISENDPKLVEAKEWILESVREIDPTEELETKKDLEKIIQLWTEGVLSDWGAMGGNQDGIRLMDPHGDLIPEVVFKVPTSLRSSDLSTTIKFWRPDGE